MPAAISNEEFLKKLTELFQTHKESGSVFLNVKRLVQHDVEDQEEDPAATNPVLFRACTNRKRKHSSESERKPKIKLSTVVKPEDLESFYAQYADALRSSISGLRKKDKKKKQRK